MSQSKRLDDIQRLPNHNSEWWIQRLFSREDSFHIHKTLGSLVLLSYSWRLTKLGVSDMGFASHPHWTLPTLCLHVALNLSSFVFVNIPVKRIKDGSRIWPEFRWHSLIFLSRHMVAVGWSTLSPPMHFLWMVLGTMAAADLASWSVGPHHSPGIRGISKASSVVKYFFSLAQFLATATVLVGLQRKSLYFFQCLVIQVTAFLLTLRRKNLVSHVWNVCAYGALLVGAVGMGLFELLVHFDQDNRASLQDPTKFCVVLILGCTATLWRIGPLVSLSTVPAWVRNKYLMWTVLYWAYASLLRPACEVGNRRLALSNRQIQLLALLEAIAVVGLGAYKHSTELPK